MRKFLALGLLMALLIGTASAALFESGTKDAQPAVLYGKYNNTIVPVKVAADGSVGGGGVSDEAYSADWNGVTDEGASKNALYDKIETIVAGGLDFALDSTSSGNIIYVGCSDSIQTAVTNATSGDTLILGSCTYTIGSTITVNKALKIYGQGRGKTVLDGGATALNPIISTTADGLKVSDLSIIGTGVTHAITINLQGTTSTSGANNIFENIEINISASDISSGFDLEDTGAVIRNSNIYVSAGNYVSSQNYCIQNDMHSTTDVDMTLRVDGLICENISADASGTSTNLVRGIRFYNYGVSSNPYNMNLIVENSIIKVRDSASPLNSIEALHVQGNRIVADIRNTVLDGYGSRTAEVSNVTKDIRCDDGAICNLENTVLSGTFYQATGTVNRKGTLSGSGLILDEAPTMRNGGNDGVAANPFIYGVGGQGGQAAGTGSRGGGEGADIILTTGLGGKAVNATTTGTAGSSGDFVLTARNGQAQDAATATTNVGGSGGYFEIVAGDGGTATNAGTTNTGGLGGSIYLSPGTGGTGASANGASGNIILGEDLAGNVSGNVLINTTNSLSKLVVGNSAANIADNIMTFYRSGTGINTGNNLGSIDWYAEDTQLVTNNYFARIRALANTDITSDAPKGDLVFYTANDSSGPTESLRITASGALVINDTAKTITVPLRVESGTDPYLIYSDGTNGRLGLGINTPVSNLDVYGDGSGGVNHGAYITLSDGDITASANDIIGRVQFWNNDSQLTTQKFYGMIDVTSAATVSTDAAQGNMYFKLTSSTAGSSPSELMSIQGGVGVVINDLSTDGLVPLRVEGSSNANLIYADGATDSVQIKSSTATAGPFIVAMPATEVIAGAGTITANACGTVKRIQSTGNQTTNTTDTFTAPAAGNTGCCMDVVNVDTADTITLDQNANFVSNGAADVVLGPGDTARVCSDGTDWYQISATGNN